MRISVRNPAFAWLAAVALGVGFAQAAQARPEATLPPDLHPIEQLAPSQGAVLVGGGSAELRWSELPAFARLHDVEEWEAFLSLDGGKSYPFRITPHLDRDLRTLRWQVPPVASADARLLFRFGNEEEGEVGYAPPIRFKIELEASVRTPMRLPEISSSRGEAARPGQPGVVSWVTGSRRGTGLRLVETRRPLDLNPRPGVAAGSPVEPLLYAPEDHRTAVRADLTASTSLVSWSPELSARPSAPSLVPPIPPLLQTHRLNE